jgi:hypothetical protein
MAVTVTDSPAISKKVEIRRLAVFTALSFGCLVMVIGCFDGKGLRKAVRDGTAASFGAMATWAAYHLVGRSNNGISIMVLPVMYPLGKGRDESLPSMVLYYLLVMVPVGILGGLTVRALESRKPRRKPTGALFDPELDQPT